MDKVISTTSPQLPKSRTHRDRLSPEREGVQGVFQKIGLKFFLAADIVSPIFLILLWTYTGLDKLIQFEASRKAFHNQTFPGELAEVLTYVIPISELLIALLLLFSITRWWGFLGSILLLTVFTTYVGLIWVGAFPRVPCNCAGILESLGWAEHFVLNLGFIGVAVWGLRSLKFKVES